MKNFLEWLARQRAEKTYVEIVTEEDKSILCSGKFPDYYWNDQIVEKFFKKVKSEGYEPRAFRFLSRRQFLELKAEKDDEFLQELKDRLDNYDR